MFYHIKQQAIAIQIHNTLVNDNSPAPSVINKQLTIEMQSREDRKSSRLSQTCTAFVKPMKQVQLLSITPTLIDFAEVEVNKASCEYFSSICTIL